MSWTENITTGVLGLQDLPVETIITILQNLEIESVDAVSQVSKRFRKIIEANWTAILRPVINREMAPVQPFIRVLRSFTSKVHTTPIKPSLGINYQGIPSSEHGSTSEEDMISESDGESSDEDALSDSDSDTSENDEDGPGGIDDLLALEMQRGEGQSHVTADDMLPDEWALGLSYASIMKVCRCTKAWEQEFHRLRFAYPHHRRTLHAHELQRLRRSFYIWWQYACEFHERNHGVEGGDQNGDRPVARMAFMRQFSTSQLHELRDMWETIKSAVGREICPSVAAVRQQSGNNLSWAEAARVGWGDAVENSQVLGTLMKLRPEDILHLLVNRHRFATKASIIQFARFKNPWIEGSVETLSDSIQWALWERERQLVVEYGPRALDRRWYLPALDFFPRPWGGIVDYKRAESEQLRHVYSRDTGPGTSYWIDDHGGPRRYLSQVPMGRLVVSRSW